MDNSNPTAEPPQCPACDGELKRKSPVPIPVCESCLQLVRYNQRRGWFAAYYRYYYNPGRYPNKRNYELATKYLIETAKELQSCTT